MSQAKPSDEMAELNLIGRELEFLLNGFSDQRKKTLKEIDNMTKLVNFEAKSKV